MMTQTLHFRYCLFGLNVGLTEKFESNSKPMKIHVSEPCKQLLPAQYKLTPRDEPELRDKVGGHASHFLDSKDGRQPLRQEVIKALLPTDSEMPKLVRKIQTCAYFQKDQFSFHSIIGQQKERRSEKG